MAIARIWRGATRSEDGDRYVAYLERTGFAEYRETEGNLGVLGLRREADGLTEFVLISLWDSEEAIRRFAGPDPGVAVFYPEDERFLVEADPAVSHYRVAYEGGGGTPGAARGDAPGPGLAGLLSRLRRWTRGRRAPSGSGAEGAARDEVLERGWRIAGLR